MPKQKPYLPDRKKQSQASCNDRSPERIVAINRGPRQRGGGRGAMPGAELFGGAALLVKRRNSKWSLPPPGGGGGAAFFDSPRGCTFPCRDPEQTCMMTQLVDQHNKNLRQRSANTFWRDPGNSSKFSRPKHFVSM